MSDHDGREHFVNTIIPGSKGLHTILDPQDIADDELAAVRNMVFNGGYLVPRQGYTQLFAQPSGETMLPNTLAVGETSDGIDMMLGIYGTNFYLWDSLNSQTILLNTSSGLTFNDIPGSTGAYQKFWSYTTWNNDTGADVMYFSNGIDTTTKWQMSLQYPAVAALSTDYQIFFPYPNRIVSTVQPTILAVLSGTPTKFTASTNSPTLTTYLGSSVNTFTLASSNGTNMTKSIDSATYVFAANVKPSNNDTLIATINGTAVTFTFVTSIGSNPGNVLIGASASSAMTNLLGLLQNSSTTSATQVALSAGNQTLIGYSTYNTLDYSATYFSGTVGTAIPLKTAITSALGSQSNVPIGSIISTFQRRLFSIGGNGNENLIQWSQVSVPENFSSLAGTVADPGSSQWAQGQGGITCMFDGGGFLVFGKRNAWAQAQFLYSNDVKTTYLFSLNEIASGKSIGTSHFKKALKSNNNIDFLTDTDGIMELSAQVQSDTTTASASPANIQFSVLSEKINNLLQDGGGYFQQNTVSSYWSQKGFWAVAESATANNTLLLVHDYLYGYWTIFDNWHVQDMNSYNQLFYFLSVDDGSVNQGFTTYQDGTQAYTSYFFTKRYDFGEPALPKTIDKVFLQGYIDQGTTLLVDIIFNENTIPLGTQTFQIMGTDAVVLRPFQGMIGNYSIGTAVIGKISAGNTTTLGVLRCYLDAAQKYGFFNMQLKFSTKIIGSTFIIDKIAMNPTLENSYDPNLVIDPL